MQHKLGTVHLTFRGGCYYLPHQKCFFMRNKNQDYFFFMHGKSVIVQILPKLFIQNCCVRYFIFFFNYKKYFVCFCFFQKNYISLSLKVTWLSPFCIEQNNEQKKTQIILNIEICLAKTCQCIIKS